MLPTHVLFSSFTTLSIFLMGLTLLVFGLMASARQRGIVTSAPLRLRVIEADGSERIVETGRTTKRPPNSR